MGNRKLSVIIPCYNKVALTQITVNSLLACSKSDLHLILVDDGSTDNTRQFGESLSTVMNSSHERFFYYQNNGNIGVNASWNAGLKIAMTLNTPYICIANNDLEFTDGWDIQLLNALDDDYWLVSPYSTELQKPADWPAGSTRHVNPVHKGMSILGACFVFRNDLIERIGFFPEQCRHYYGDNWIQDMCSIRGLKAGHIYESYIHHFFCQTTRELDNNYWFQMDRKAYYNFCQNFRLENNPAEKNK